MIDQYIKTSSPLWGFGVESQTSQHSQLERSWGPKNVFSHPLEAHETIIKGQLDFLFKIWALFFISYGHRDDKYEL